MVLRIRRLPRMLFAGSGARGIGQILQDGFEFELDASISMYGLVLGEQR